MTAMEQVHRLGRDLLRREVHIVLTGSDDCAVSMAMALPHLQRSLLTSGHPGMSVTIMDAATISETSCGLLPYLPSDVGSCRGAALIERINPLWQVDWRAVPEDLSNADQLNDVDIVICCAKGNYERARIAEAAEASRSVAYLLDIVLSERGGCFVLGEPLTEKNAASRKRLPVAHELFPQLAGTELDDGDAYRPEIPSVPGELLLAGQIVSSHATLLLMRVFQHGSTPYHGGVVGPRGGVRPLFVRQARARQAR